MTVKRIGGDSSCEKFELIGLSSDTKPTNVGAGSTFYELDTKNGFIFDGSTWWGV